MKAITTFLVTLPLLFAVPTQAAAEDLTIQAPPEVTILDVAADETLQPDGHRVRWTSVTYELSTGHEAEMFVEVDDRGRGDGYIFIEGEALLHVTTDEHGATTTWVAPDIDLPPEALAQLATVNVADEIFAGIGEPQAFKCSDFGKGVVKAAKYLWVGLAGAAGAACCAGGLGVGCLVCGGATSVAILAGTEAADGYCE
jgi:hypothetical protein